MRPPVRYESLDFLKALGIIYLIVLHHLIWVLLLGDYGTLRYEQGRSLGMAFGVHSGLHVLGFQLPLLAGMTFFMMLKTKDLGFKEIALRALILCLLGFMMNLFTWGPRHAFDWDVLPFIALSMLIAYPFLRFFPTGLATSILILIGMIALRFSSAFPFGFQDYYLYYVIFGDPAGGHFWPLCPWFILFALGIFTGDVFCSQSRKMMIFLIIIGAVLLITSMTKGDFFPASRENQVWGPALFKPSPYFVLGIMGFSLSVLPLTHLIFEKWKSARDFLKRSGFLYFSYGILWIYLISTVVGYHLTVLVLNRLSLDYAGALVALTMLILFQLVVAFFIGKTIFEIKKNNKERLS